VKEETGWWVEVAVEVEGAELERRTVDAAEERCLERRWNPGKVKIGLE
jgi:hypothetical protein